MTPGKERQKRNLKIDEEAPVFTPRDYSWYVVNTNGTQQWDLYDKAS